MFKIDLSRFKKTAQDDTHTTLSTPEGHEFKVAHKALKGHMRKQLESIPMAEAMADGGKPHSPEDIIPAGGGDLHAGPDSSPPSSSAPVGEVAQPAKIPTGNTKIPGTLKDAERGAGFAKGGQVNAYADGGDAAPDDSQPNPVTININSGQPTPVQSTPPQAPGMWEASDARAKEVMAQDALQKAETNQKIGNALGNAWNKATTPMGAQPQAAPEQAPTLAPQQAGATPPPANMPQAQAQGNAMDSYSNIMGQGANLEEQGLREKAAADTAGGQQAAGFAQQAAQAAQQQLNHTQQLQSSILQENQKFQSDLENQHIDPNRVWSNTSTAGKIGSALGMILGGIGAGITGGKNPAVEFLNQQIDRDIDAQRAEMGKKQNLLTHNMQTYRDQSTAETVTRMQMNDVLAHQMQQAAATNQSPQAKAAMDMAIGQLKQKNALYLSQVSAPGAKQGSMDDYLAMMRIADPARAKEIESRYIPGVGMASIPIDQANRDVITSRKILGDNIKELTALSAKYGGSLQGIVDPTVKAKAEALAKQVQDQYRRANQQGVFKPAEAEFVNGVIADNPTSLFAKVTKIPAYKAAADINQANLNALYRAHGIQPMGQPQQQSSNNFGFTRK